MMTITSEIIGRLSRGITRGEIYLEELRLGTGYGGINERRIDLMKIETAPSKGHKVTVYEVKISRADFRSDIKNPKKQRGARLFSDQFFYVTPPGLLKIDDIPLWAGLIEVDLAQDNYAAIKTIVPAPALDKERPSWGLFCAAIRNSSGWTTSQTMIQKNAALQSEIRKLEGRAWQQELEIKRLNNPSH